MGKASDGSANKEWNVI